MQMPAQPPMQPQAPMQMPAQAPMQMQAQAPMQMPAQAPMQMPAQPPMQMPAQAPMQMQAQPPMQAPMQFPAQAPVQAPQLPAQAPMQMQAPQAPVAPAAPQVRGLLSELLTKLTAPGASPKGAQWCGQELPRAMSALQTAQHQQGVLQDASSRLTTTAAVAEKAAKDLDSRDAALATVAGEAGRDVKAEAAVLAAEVQQHDVALHALREGLAVMEDAQDMRDVAGGLEDLQELAKDKRREQHDAGLRAAAATRDSQENAEQIAL